MTTAIPFHPPASRRQLSLDSSTGSPEEELPSVALIQVDARYFDVLGMRPTRGRSFLPADAWTGQQDVVNPNLPVYYAQTLDDAFAEARYGIRIIGGWFGALAVIALALAAIGLFAITGHAVAQRTQEIGVRIALGARNREVVWLFLRRTLVRLALGTAIGLAGALGMGQLLQNFIGRTDPRDPLTLVLVTMLIVLVAVVASLLPARRATRIYPIVALRY
jgi:ABC-type antimicrobial peptide transport system permease subunit